MSRYIVLDRITPDRAQPPYCVHGRATCTGCGTWCWLGDQTYEEVYLMRAQPICKECANVAPALVQTGHIQDHLRADGPH